MFDETGGTTTGGTTAGMLTYAMIADIAAEKIYQAMVHTAGAEGEPVVRAVWREGRRVA